MLNQKKTQKESKIANKITVKLSNGWIIKVLVKKDLCFFYII